MLFPLRAKALLVDGRDFRRACIESLLAAWAPKENLEIVSLPPAEAHRLLAEHPDFRLLIYSAGDPQTPAHEALAEIGTLRALCPAAAFAVLAADEDPATIFAAINMGVQAYISNVMNPDLALHALSFALCGGTYFSPTALASVRHGAVSRGLFSCGPRNDTAAVASERSGRTGDAGQDDRASPSQQQGSMPNEIPVRRVADPPAFACPAECEELTRTQWGPLTDRQQSVLRHLCQGDPNKVIANKLGLTETTVKVHVREIMRKLGVCNRTQVAIVVGRTVALATMASEPVPKRLS